MMDYHLLTGKCDGNCDWCQCPPEREEPWKPMETAPKDGTKVELLMYHRNRQYAKGEEKLMWEQVVVAKWIDFNGGGWTWHGMAGAFVGWRPLVPNACIQPPPKAVGWNDGLAGYPRSPAELENDMAPHQERVVTEKADLDEKLTKLKAFFDTDLFKSLNEDEQERMRRQADHMGDYSSVLGERIAAF